METQPHTAKISSTSYATFYRADRTLDDTYYVTIQLRTTEQRVPFNKITPYQYMEGSLSKLRDMIATELDAATSVNGPFELPNPNYEVRVSQTATSGFRDIGRPENSSVNDFALKKACVYLPPEDAASLLSPSSFIAKVDLKAAYRSVTIRPGPQVLTRLRWIFSGDDSLTCHMSLRVQF